MKEQSYFTKDFNAFVEMVNAFNRGTLAEIDGICLGVAGAVTRGKVKGTNFPRGIDSEKINAELLGAAYYGAMVLIN